MIKNISRLRLTAAGQVQGVGFRPFVFRLAVESGLSGLVKNTPDGVIIEIQGPRDAVRTFPARLTAELPPLAMLTSLTVMPISVIPDEQGFRILSSDQGQGHNVLISPDTATCPDCLREINDPDNRRHLYPFTNCTNCGPRYTITSSVPYDRRTTSMACFPMCPQCQAEYDNPQDRRFHAQPNACPVCGPKVWTADRIGPRGSEGFAALKETVLALRDGGILAVKGLGGFHLACDATSPAAVTALRQRKNRKDKPLAVMVPDLTTVNAIALTTPEEVEILTGRQRPIVLLTARPDSPLAPDISPDTEHIGVMLPYTPLHHILLGLYREILPAGRIPALVMTSGNLSSEPIALGNREALDRLGDIADLFLLHNRDILIRCDDSVVRHNADSHRLTFLRRARGYTPAPVLTGRDLPTALGVGPELKATVCLTKKDTAFVSQHIGDLENLETLRFHGEIIEHLKSVLRVTPEAVVADLHPDYLSTGYARERSGLPVFRLQHHFAHIHAALAENRHWEPSLGLALDGTGLGDDGTLWGGEGLFVDPLHLEHRRLAHLAPIRLPGGSAAIREPWRIAQACLHALGVRAPQGRPWPWLDGRTKASEMVTTMLDRNLNSPVTTSCGRLFDAVSALLGLKLEIAYEGQAAIVLERVQTLDEYGAYACEIRETDGLFRPDTLDIFRQVHADWEQDVPPAIISRRFHVGLARVLAETARLMSRHTGCSTVALSGGVMQNQRFSDILRVELISRNLLPLEHSVIPPNDACISLGQAVYGGLRLSRE